MEKKVKSVTGGFIKCKICKDSFYTVPSDKDRKYCSRKCQNSDKELNNLIALCAFCNSSVNKNRIEWINLFKKKIASMQEVTYGI